MSAFVQTVVGSDSPPIGAVMDFAGNVEPSGWLFCFGQSLPRTGIYAQLFGVIGTLYGAPDGSSFSLPDFRGRVGAGKDNMGGTAANRMTAVWSMDGTALGANGGTESYVLTTPQIPSHTHTVQQWGLVSGTTFTTGPNAMGNSQFNSGATGGGLAHPNVQPTFIVNKIIKYTVSGTVLPVVPGDGDVTGPASSVDGDLAVYNGTSGKILTGSSRVGSVVQSVYGTYTANVNLTVLIPVDDTVPQNTEGTEIISVSFTPRFANSRMVLRFSGVAASSVICAIVVSIFRDSAANAITSTVSAAGVVNQIYPITILVTDSPATISTVTYAVRAGPQVAATVRFNGSSSARVFGGVSVATLEVQEIKQ